MLKYIFKRILILIPVLICITIVLFSVNKMMPGDPVRAMLPTNLKAEQYDAAYTAMRAKLGLDQPVAVQYVKWVGNMLQGEFGWSSSNNRPVAEVVSEPIRNTVILNIGVIIIQLAISIPVGIRCAVKRGGLFDNFWQVFSLITWSMPSFFLALCLLFIFAINLGWFPFGGMPNAALTSGWAYIADWLWHLVLPTIVLSLISIANTIRIVRTAMIDALSQDYIRTARAKGLREHAVIYSHAFRNALIPVSTVVVGTLFSLFAGSTITETIFAWNGIGKVLISAINQRDTMLVSTMNTFFALVSVTAVLVSDIVYGLIDPRIRLE